MSWYYIEGILINCGYVLMVVLGLSLLTGFTGLFSFGHAGFMAIGAYTASICTMMLGIPYPIALLLGGVAAMLAGLFLGSFTLKLKGDYFCIATLGFGEAVRLIFDNVQALGGARGLTGMKMYTTLPAVLVVSVLAVAALVCLIRSRHGRNMVAIREDELAAQVSGINVFYYKMMALGISALYAGIGGGLLAHYMGYIQPLMFKMVKSTEYTIIVIFGGLGSVTGSVVGTLLLTFLPEVLREFENWRLVLYGLAVIIIMISRPRGLMGGTELTIKGMVRFFKNPFGLAGRLANAKKARGGHHNE
ncbi:MAG: branched-chain amino acid ABC transporter permease [Clostridia bacterium]|nr:branched-chain amino acid ABC transporter permease [Candidatus Pelethousia sp.]NCB30651.1 branched-chain amino acid ABC transporter permease [Clostridia bacterium]